MKLSDLIRSLDCLSNKAEANLLDCETMEAIWIITSAIEIYLHREYQRLNEDEFKSLKASYARINEMHDCLFKTNKVMTSEKSSFPEENVAYELKKKCFSLGKAELVRHVLFMNEKIKQEKLNVLFLKEQLKEAEELLDKTDEEFEKEMRAGEGVVIGRIGKENDE